MSPLLIATIIVLALWSLVFWLISAKTTEYSGIRPSEAAALDSNAMRETLKKKRVARIMRMVKIAAVLTVLIYAYVFIAEPAKKVQAALWPTVTSTPSITPSASSTPTLKPTLSGSPTYRPTLAQMQTSTPLVTATPKVITQYLDHNVPVTVIVRATQYIYVNQTVIVPQTVIVYQTVVVTPTFTATATITPTFTPTFTEVPLEIPTETPTETIAP